MDLKWTQNGPKMDQTFLKMSHKSIVVYVPSPLIFLRGVPFWLVLFCNSFEIEPVFLDGCVQVVQVVSLLHSNVGELATEWRQGHNTQWF